MKLLVLCAVVAFAAADMCAEDGSNAANLETVQATVTTIANMYTSHCSIDGETLADIFFANENCVALFEQGYCYGNVAMAKYEDATEESVTWEDVKAGIANAEYMGTLACNNVEACFTPLKEAAIACWTNSEDFQAEIRGHVDTLYTTAATFAASYSEENKNDMVSILMDMAMSEFQSADDIFTAIEENSEDLLSAYQTAVATASEFCTSGCVEKTADYATAALDATTGDGMCEAVGSFCGSCSKAMGSHFKNNAMPCCLTTVVDKAIAAWDENAAAAAEDLAKKVSKKVNKKDKKKIKAAKDEATCARRAYGKAAKEEGCGDEEA